MRHQFKALYYEKGTIRVNVHHEAHFPKVSWVTVSFLGQGTGSPPYGPDCGLSLPPINSSLHILQPILFQPKTLNTHNPWY